MAMLESLARAGFLGYGVLHLLFGWLIVRIAFGGKPADGDQSGALQALAAKPFGAALITLIVLGLAAMAIWQLGEAVAGHRGERGRHRVYERVVSAGRAAFYVYLGVSGVKVLRGKHTSSADTQQQAGEDLMASTGGRFTVGAVGVAVAAIGTGHLRARPMTKPARRISRPLGVVGYAAKGAGYGIAGVLFVIAAVRYDPEKARGLDAALRALAQQAYGPWLLLLTAVGFAAYGLFSIAEAKYREV